MWSDPHTCTAAYRRCCAGWLEPQTAPAQTSTESAQRYYLKTNTLFHELPNNPDFITHPALCFHEAWPNWQLVRATLCSAWVRVRDTGPSSTCEFAVGLHVLYSRRDREDPARRALDLDVRISLYKGLCYPDTKTANDRTLKSTWKPGKWKMCCWTMLIHTWSRWCCPLCVDTPGDGGSYECETCRRDCQLPAKSKENSNVFLLSWNSAWYGNT